MLTARATEMLRQMKAAEEREEWEDAELVCDGFDCWLGLDKFSRKTVNVLLRCTAITLVSEPGSSERFTISATGRAILEDPTVADRVFKALISRTPCDEFGNPLQTPTGFVS